MRTRDVVIIGAGPAGMAAAARLHRLGVRDVQVLERADFPRDKPCGGGLTGRCDAALAALGLRLAVPHVPAHRARLRFGAFERVVALPRPVAVIRRIEFDHSLAAQVRALGVEVVTGARVAEVALEGDAVALRLASGAQCRARVVVGADGVASVVRKHLCGGLRLAPHRLFMQELPLARPGDDLLFDFTPMLCGVRGYVWAFPVSGARVNVGVLHYPSTQRTSAELLHALRAGLARADITLPPRGARGWPLWGFEPRAPVAAARLLVAGDAAGIDALTGEGIAVALEQGRIAADAVARALASGDFRFAEYGQELRRALVGRELMLDRWLARRLYQAGPAWQRWMRRLLFDRDFAELYAARMAGAASLPAGRLALLRATGRDLLEVRARRRRFAQALAGWPAVQAGCAGGAAVGNPGGAP